MFCGGAYDLPSSRMPIRNINTFCRVALNKCASEYYSGRSRCAVTAETHDKIRLEGHQDIAFSYDVTSEIAALLEKEGLCELCGNARFYALFYLIPLRLPFP